MPAHVPDLRAREAMQKYIVLLNEIQALGMQGFAKLLDTATAAEMTELLAAVDMLLLQVARVKK